MVTLVSWLEDSKIRELQISEREGLKVDRGQLWDTSFQEYLTRLSCPLTASPETLPECVEWLVSHAIAVEFEECSEACVGLEGEMAAKNDRGGDSKNTDMEVCEGNSETNIPQNEMKDTKFEIDTLGNLVNLKRNENEIDVDFLQRISRQIRLLLTPGSLEALKSNVGSESLADFPLGFDTKDAIVNQVAVVLKMLYLSDFRELQNDLNALIVLGQEVISFAFENSFFFSFF